MTELCWTSLMTLIYWDLELSFEKHLRSVSRPASQRLGILRNFWRVFNDRLLLGKFFRFFSDPFWSTVLQCGGLALWCGYVMRHADAWRAMWFVTRGVVTWSSVCNMITCCVCVQATWLWRACPLSPRKIWPWRTCRSWWSPLGRRWWQFSRRPRRRWVDTHWCRE